MIGLALVVSLLGAAPEDAQGIEIYPYDGDSSGSVKLQGSTEEVCRLGRRDVPCVFSAEPGPATLVINGRPYPIEVRPGLTTFAFARKSTASWLFTGGLVSCVAGTPLTFFGLMGMVFLASSSAALAAGVAVVGGVLMIAAFPLMVSALLVPSGELMRVQPRATPDRYVAAAERTARANPVTHALSADPS